MADEKNDNSTDIFSLKAGNLFSSLGTAASSYYNAEVNKIINDMKSAQLEFNAKMAEIQAEQEIVQGNKDAKLFQEKSLQVIGAQKSGFASGNVVTNFGTARDIQDQTYQYIKEDASTIRNNAWKRAFGYKAEAAQTRLSKMVLDNQSDMQYTNTLVQGGLGASVQYGTNYMKIKAIGKQQTKKSKE